MHDILDGLYSEKPASSSYADYFRRPTKKFALNDMVYEGGEWAAKLRGTLESARAARALDGSLSAEAISVMTGTDPGAAKRLQAGPHTRAGFTYCFQGAKLFHWN